MPRLPRLLAPALLPCLLCLGACAPRLAPVARLPILDSLLTCQAQPPPPAALATDADLTDWVQDLADAGADCRFRLEAVRGVVQP